MGNSTINMKIIVIIVGLGLIVFHSHIARFAQKIGKLMHYDSPFSMRVYSYPKYLLITKILYIIMGIALVIAGILQCFGIL